MSRSPSAPPPSPPAGGDPPLPAGIAAALGRIPSGLFVVTWRWEEQDRGMLASWVMQCGFEPPMVAIAVAPSRELLTAASRGVPYVVNVLSESQRSLLSRFGKPGDDAFAGLPVERTSSGTAAFTEAAAWLECRPVPEAGPHEAGDHVLLRGIVIAAASEGERQPLVHVRRNGLRY